MEEYNHFVDNLDVGKSIRPLAKKVSSMIVEGMKNLTDLQKKTNDKFKQQIIDNNDEEEDEDIDIVRSKHRKTADQNKQRDYFVPDHPDLNFNSEQPEERPYRKPKQLSASQAGPQAVAQPPPKKKQQDERKELLSLVNSQFGEGFLELDFGGDEKVPEKKPPAEKPAPGPASVKKPEQAQKYAAYEFHHDGPGSNPTQKKPVLNRSAS